MCAYMLDALQECMLSHNSLQNMLTLKMMKLLVMHSSKIILGFVVNLVKEMHGKVVTLYGLQECYIKRT